MKTKILKYVFVVAIAMVAGINVFNAQKSEALSDVALANVEALASTEHGNIDETLVPYRKLDSKTIYLVYNGQIVSTVIPCCKDDTSRYSGCAKGLDEC